MSDLENVIAALNLEYGANRRYAYQMERSTFSQLNNILEGVRRTEGDHVEAMRAYIARQAPTDPAVGRGFASMLAHLRLNLEFERTAVNAYGQFARETDDAELKRTFQQLARSEAGHINLFQSLIAQIEANQFPVLVYCPVCGWELDFGVNPADGTVVRCEKCKQRVAIQVNAGDFALEAV
ncbi:MAG TPA: ferritin-like domain-containing protein [Armatimonadota bacterium]|jgi:rubrerythrin